MDEEKCELTTDGFVAMPRLRLDCDVPKLFVGPPIDFVGDVNDRVIVHDRCFFLDDTMTASSSSSSSLSAAAVVLVQLLLLLFLAMRQARSRSEFRFPVIDDVSTRFAASGLMLLARRCRRRSFRLPLPVESRRAADRAAAAVSTSEELDRVKLSSSILVVAPLVPGGGVLITTGGGVGGSGGGISGERGISSASQTSLLVHPPRLDRFAINFRRSLALFRLDLSSLPPAEPMVLRRLRRRVVHARLTASDVGDETPCVNRLLGRISRSILFPRSDDNRFNIGLIPQSASSEDPLRSASPCFSSSSVRRNENSSPSMDPLPLFFSYRCELARCLCIHARSIVSLFIHKYTRVRTCVRDEYGYKSHAESIYSACCITM